MKNLTDRKEYLDKLLSYKDSDIIKVITGLRRAEDFPLSAFAENITFAPENIKRISNEFLGTGKTALHNARI
jgi:succinate dehydrogenase flavin-adding protein (antitoxin of CptAB toxin-antitoxin module)